VVAKGNRSRDGEGFQRPQGDSRVAPDPSCPDCRTTAIASQGTDSFTVAVGDQKLNAEVPNTGNYGKLLQSVAIRVIDLTKPGKTTLSIKAVAAHWQPLYVRSIKLAPAK
jgi:hypothetical protein